MDQPEGATFAELLKRFRKRAQLTQMNLAERLGSHRSTVSFWERGEYVPETLMMVLELARVLRLGEAEKRLLVEARFGTASILPLYNLPEQNPYFTGREALLEMLHRSLAAGEQVALVQTQAISGLGGIGKTQLALAYAYRYRAHYHDILWALADSRETLVASYVTFAQHLRLDLGAAAHEQPKAVEAVKRWLREHRGWLLILDNLEDLGLVREFVPAPRQGAVVLTTRRAETSPVARTLALDELQEEEGLLFLLRRSGRLALETTLAEASLHHYNSARAIVQELGGLPLALDQAGGYIAETRCSVSDYLALFQQEHHTLLQRRGAVPSEHPEPVTTTFALAFAQVELRNELATQVLRLCAFLAPEAIPLDLLIQGTADLRPDVESGTAQTLAFNAALETLQAYSLVRREAEQGRLSLHRLVQAVQKEALSEPEQKRWAERAVRLLSAAFPMPTPATWERCQQLIPHALLCAEHIRRWGVTFPEAASLLHRTGIYLSHRAAYEQALPLLQGALALQEQVADPDRQRVAEILNDLALLILAQGQYNQALPLLQRTLAIREQVLPPQHPDIAETLNSLATLYWSWGRYEQTLPLLQRALAIREQALGSTHPDVATILNTLAASYRVLGQYERALPLVKRALSIFEQTFGPTYPDVAWSLTSLANIYHALGQGEQALPLFQRALAIREQAWGPDHPLVAQSLNNLADLYRAQGQYYQALPLAERALAIREQALGANHAHVAESLNTLARLYEAQGEYEQALPLAEQGLAIREQALGPVHPDVATILNTLALIFCDQGRYAEAVPLAKRALAIREQALGSSHPSTAESLNTLARLYEGQGQYAQALPLFKRALTILEQVLPGHPATAIHREHLTAVLHQRERA